MGRDIALGDGLYRVVQKSGYESYAVRYRSPVNKRRQMKVTLGKCSIVSLKEARRRARELLGQVAQGVDPVAAKRDARGEVWETVVEKFLAHSREHNRRSTTYTYSNALTRSDFDAFKGRRVGTIRWRDISAIIDGIKARGAPVQANRQFSVLRQMFNFAVAHELLERNPCDHKSKPAKEVSRDRVLSDEELARIWRACSQVGYPYGPLVQMLILTGQRRDEV